MSEEKSNLSPRELCRAHLLDAAIALRAAIAIAPTLEEIALARVHPAAHDAQAIVTTCLQHFQHADDVRNFDRAVARDARNIEQTITYGTIQR